MSTRNRQEIVADGGSAIVIDEQPSESPSQAVIRGVAVVKGVSEHALDPLYESVDPESLDDAIQHSQRHGSDVSVEFCYEGYAVLVGSDDEITLTAPSRGYSSH